MSSLINQNLANVRLVLKGNNLLIPVLDAECKNNAFTTPKARFLQTLFNKFFILKPMIKKIICIQQFIKIFFRQNYIHFCGKNVQKILQCNGNNIIKSFS